MTTPKHLEANRRNAQLPTGPRTPEGKAVVARNALKYGLLPSKALLPGESDSDLAELSRRLRNDLRPVGEMENLLVDRIIASTWRLVRLEAVEAGLFHHRYYDELIDRAKAEAQKYKSGNLHTLL